MPTKSLVFLSSLFLAGSVAFAQNPSPAQATAPPATAAAPAAQTTPADYKIPAEAAKLPNPVKRTAESIANGKKMYGYDCAMCHGVSGDGKGDLAGDMKLQLSDFRDAKSLAAKTDGELFYEIKNGKGQMPAEGTRAKADIIWDMVNYVRSLAKPGKAEKPETVAKTEPAAKSN